MSQLSLAFDVSLMIRDEQGRYLPASAEQILDAARKVIDQKVQRGAALTSSEMVMTATCTAGCTPAGRRSQCSGIC